MEALVENLLLWSNHPNGIGIKQLSVVRGECLRLRKNGLAIECIPYILVLWDDIK